MILGFIGGVMCVIGLGAGSVSTAVIGGILAVCGVMMINEDAERTRARINRQRYWAYGEEPDWAREREKNRGKG